MSSPTSCRLFFPIPNISRPLSLLLAPDYRRLAVAWLIFRSIQRSRTVLRSFQRLPRLNGGISPSVMQRYRVSGEMPRYCDACRTFITSRDSLTRNATPASAHTPEALTVRCTRSALRTLRGCSSWELYDTLALRASRDSMGLLS